MSHAKYSIARWLIVHFIFAGGIALLGNVLLLCGLSGHFSPQWVIVCSASIVFLVFICIIFLFKKYQSHRKIKQKDRFELLLIVFLCAFVFLTILQGLVPPHARDALIQHLALPLVYLQRGTIKDLGFAEQAYNPLLVDLLFAFPLAFKIDWVAAFMHYFFALATAHLLYSFCSLIYERKAGLVAAVLFLSLPIVIQSGSQAYVDLAITYYACLSWVCLDYSLRNSKRNNLILASGFFCGCGLAIKYNALLTIPLTMVLLLLACQRLKWSSKKTLVALSCFAVTAVIGASISLTKNWMWTGNPIYPFLRSVIGWKGIVEGSLGVVPPLVHRYFIYHEPWWKILALPFRIFFIGEEGDPRLFDGRLSPILIVFLPFLFRTRGRDRTLACSIVFLTVFYLLYAMMFVIMRIRYLLPIIPLLVLLTVMGWKNLMNASLKRAASSLLICFLFAHLFWACERLQKEQAIGFLFGKINRQEYLSKRLPEYSVQLYANQNLQSSDKILFVFLGDRGYYCHIPYTYDFHDPGRSWRRWLRNADRADTLVEEIRREGITHLMIHRGLLLSSIDTGFNLKDQERKVFLEFLQTKVKVLDRHGEVELLEI